MKRVLVAMAIVAVASTSAMAVSLTAGASTGQYYNWEMLYAGPGFTNTGSGFYYDPDTSTLHTHDGVGAGPGGANTIYLGDNFGTLRVNALSHLTAGTYYTDPGTASASEEITGIFYGIDVVTSNVGGGGSTELLAEGGRLDLYHEVNPSSPTRYFQGGTDIDFAVSKIGVSGGLPTYQTATEGTRLVSFLFADGIVTTAGITLQGTFNSGVPSNGSASFYANVLVDAAPWAELLDTNGQIGAFGPRDLLAQNSFFTSGGQLTAVGGLHGWDLFSTDPFFFEAIPEPGTFALLGLGLVGLGVAARRRRRS